MKAFLLSFFGALLALSLNGCANTASDGSTIQNTNDQSVSATFQ